MSDSIYISSSCIRAKKIADAVESLAIAGFDKIELSGGTHLYAHWLEDLLELKEKYNLTYRCHNYFPPPETSFVLNLSSSIDYEKSLTFIKKTLAISADLGADKFGLHAGFRIEPKVSELGKKISSANIMPYEEAFKRFQAGILELSQFALVQGVELYVENNVFSDANYRSFKGKNPFLLTHASEYKNNFVNQHYKLLLDVAHLKVSCKTLGLNFYQQLKVLTECSDYLHISDNNGLSDLNLGLKENSMLYQELRDLDLSGKTFTLEIYEDLKEIEYSYILLDRIL